MVERVKPRQALWAVVVAVFVCGGLQAAAAERAASSPPALPQYVPKGKIVVDLGYRPKPNGFSFPNYAGSANELTPVLMQRLFGKAVCRAGSGTSCLLHPPAQAWLAQTNTLMSGGLCVGFSVDSLLFYKGKVLQPKSFGAPTTFGLRRTPALDGLIAYGWTFQLLDRVVSAEVDKSPAKVVSTLIAALKTGRELYTVAVFKPNFEGGHAMTPFAVEKRPDGKVAILVYDNNWPGETRAVIVDPARNTWRYAASAFPDRPTEVYKGGPKTKTLVLLPTTPGLGLQPCPFCRNAASRAIAAVGAGAAGYDRISLGGDPRNHPSLLITDKSGRRLGIVKGKLVDQIPGARVIRRLLDRPGWADHAEPELLVPAGLDLTILVDGSALKTPSVSSVALTSPGSDAVVNRISLAAGEKATLTLRGSGSTLAFDSGSQAVSPVLSIGTEGVSVDRAFSVTATGMTKGSTLAVSLDAVNEHFRIQPGGPPAAGGYDVKMDRLDDQGSDTFEQDNLSIQSDQSATLDYAGWEQPGDPLPIDVAEDTFVPVPDVTGQDAASATATLEDAGFTVEVVDTPTSDPTEVGVVVDQSPASGTQAPEGSTVVISVGVQPDG